MSPKKKPAAELNILRQKAEKALKTTRAQVKKMTSEDVQHLVHDLQVHQIELEMQNEELRRAQLDLEMARDRYATLFDFTPVGYVTLNQGGRIQEANLTFCHLLGLSRRDLLRRPFETYVDPEDQGAFRLYLNALQEKDPVRSSDVLTLRHSGNVHRVRLEGCLETINPPLAPASLFRIAVVDVTVWERVEIERDEQKALIELGVKGAMDAIVTTDEKEQIVLFNESAERMFRTSAATALHGPLDRFIPKRFRVAHHRHHQQFQENAERIREMGASREILGLRADGEEFPIEATISQLELKGKGKGKGKRLFTVVMRDISERRQALAAVKNEQQFIGAVLDTTAALLVVLDTQGNIVRFNRACEILTGFSCDEIANKPVWETVLPSMDVESVKEYFQTLLQGHAGNVHENYWITKQKELRWISWSNTLLRDKDGDVKYIISSGIDMTEQRKMQEALEEEREFISEVLDTAGALMVILDSDRNILRINRACEKMVQYAFADLKGQPFWNLCVSSGEDNQGAGQTLESYKAGRLPEVFEAALVNQSRKISWIQWNTTAIYDERGGVKYYIATGTDITLRKQSEQDLQTTHQALEKQKQELKSLTAQLLNTQEEERRRISRDLHDDVNQRLALLSFQLQSAQKELPESHPSSQVLKDLDQDVAKLSDDVRHLAYQYHPSILDDLGLEAALRSLIKDFSRWEGLAVTLHASNVPNTLSPEVASCLYRVAQEGLRNISRHAQALNVRLELSGEYNGLTLALHDDGQGFHHPEGQSIGLGLVSMRERVQLVHGKLRMESQPGRGTTVGVWVPVGEPKP